MDESELRSQLREADEDAPRVDVDAVLRRSRRRRAPRVALVGGAAALLVVGLAVPAVGTFVMASSGGGASSAGSAGSGSSGDAEDQGMTPERQDATAGPLGDDGDQSVASGTAELLRCGVASPPASGTGLRLELGLDRTASPDGTRTGVATLTNTGAVAVHGTTPAVAQAGLAQSGRLAAVHAASDIQSVFEVDLQPGQTVQVPVSIEPVGCDGDALAAGDYAAVAALRIVLDDGSTRAVVSSPVDVRVG